MKKNKVLVIQTAFLGDSVLTLPLIKTLKECTEIEQVDVLSRADLQDIFKSSDSVDEVIPWDKGGYEGGVFGTLKVAKKLRKRNYDKVFLPQRSFRSGLIATFGRIPERIGFRRGGARIFLTSSVDFDWDIHEVERLLSLAEPAGCRKLIKDYGLSPEIEMAAKFKEIYEDGDKKIVGIAPQSVWPTKCWPLKRFKEAAERLSKKAVVVVFGIERQNWGEETINLTGKTSIKELIAAISEIDILLSNDSGLMHIAAAFSKPSVVIYGATVPELGFTPYGNKSVIIERDLDCRPCGLHGPKSCPKGHFKCMKDIQAEEVVETVLSNL